MGFNRRKMEAQRKAQADAEAAARRAADTQVFADAERQSPLGMPLLFTPTIGRRVGEPA